MKNELIKTPELRALANALGATLYHVLEITERRADSWPTMKSRYINANVKTQPANIPGSQEKKNYPHNAQNATH